MGRIDGWVGRSVALVGLVKFGMVDRGYVMNVGRGYVMSVSRGYVRIHSNE